MTANRTRPGLLQSLRARYDGTTLRPPDATVEWRPGDETTLQALRQWCLAGAVPRATRPFAMAQLRADPAGALRLATQLSLQLDGSLRLQATGAVGGLALRLQTKWRDLSADVWRGSARRADDPWDCGHLVSTDPGLHALGRFEPRRATLLVVDGAETHAVARAAATLQARAPGWARPVRLLVLNGDGAAASGDDVAVFRPAGPAH